MKMRVGRWDMVPYGGTWKFTHPVTGQSIFGRSRAALIDMAKAHAISNNLPIGVAFDSQVEEMLCHDMPKECVPCRDNLPMRPPTIGLRDVLRGTKVMLAAKKAGMPLVDMEESDRRAKICMACPYNIDVRMPCSGICPELRKIVESVMGSQAILHNRNLKSCGVCHCVLAAAVRLPLEIQCVGVTDDMKDIFKQIPDCWKQCV